MPVELRATDRVGIDSEDGRECSPSGEVLVELHLRLKLRGNKREAGECAGQDDGQHMFVGLRKVQTWSFRLEVG